MVFQINEHDITIKHFLHCDFPIGVFSYMSAYFIWLNLLVFLNAIHYTVVIQIFKQNQTYRNLTGLVTKICQQTNSKCHLLLSLTLCTYSISNGTA